MAGSARIDELKKKFDENPGRYFAPLANEYRKAGEIEQAISICRTYLAEKPGHMSGLIVFGQALYEATQFDEARSTFEQALALDPENLIALRHLGDIARDIGDPVSARGWYQRVLDADPRNEEIAAELAAVKDAVAAAPAAPAAAAAESGGMSGWGDINPEQSAAAEIANANTAVIEPVRPPEPAFAEPARPSLQLLAIDEPMPSADIERDMPAMEFEPTSFAPSAAPTDSGSLGIERTQEFAIPSGGGELGGIELDRPFEAPLDLPKDTSADLGLEPREFAPPAPDESAVAADMRVSLAFEPPASLMADSDTADRTSGALSGLPTFDDSPPSEPAQETKEPAAVTGASGFVTETMAELYLAQGYRSEAIGVYRQLVQQSPNDESLREKLRKIEEGDVRSSGSQPKVVEPVQSSSAAASSAAGPARSGRSARSFFGSLASRRAPQRASDPYQNTFESPAETPPREADVTGPSDWIMEPNRSSASTEVPELPPATPPVTSDAFGSSDDSWPEPTPAAASSGADTGWGIAPVTSATPARGSQAEPEAAPEHSLQQEAPSVETEQPAPAMTGSLDSLFSGRAVPSADDAAASMLAGAFAPHDSAAATPAPASPAPRTSGASAASTPSGSGAPSQRGQPARAAVGELSLDHVFKDSPRKSGAVRQTGGFSFDQFFSDTATAQPSDKSTGPDGEVNPTEGSTRNDDEVGHFTSWLEGLKKK